MTMLATGGDGYPDPRWPSYYRIPKRAMDIMLALVGIALCGPMFLAIAVFIKATSRHSVFYRGVRTGRYGVPFRIWKFRTMVEGVERLGGPTTGTGDPRVTSMGRFLRRTKLDELPQLLNVLCGDMSFVGPRPEVLEYTAQYSGEERLILSVRPGITDMSSLVFVDLDSLVGSEDPDGYFRKHILPIKNAHRVRYVKEASLLLDLSLIARSVLAVATRMVERGTANGVR